MFFFRKHNIRKKHVIKNKKIPPGQAFANLFRLKLIDLLATSFLKNYYVPLPTQSKLFCMRFFYQLTAFVAMLLFIVSCGGGSSESEDVTVEFDSLSLSQNYHLDNDSTQPSCNLKVKFVFPSDMASDTVLAKVRSLFVSSTFGEVYADSLPSNALDAYAREYVDAYRENAKLFYTDAKLYASDEDVATDYYSHYETLITRIVYKGKGLLSFQVEQLNYKGGVDSFTSFRNYVVDLKTGNRLTEEDIFLPDYDRLLRPILIDKLLKMNKVENISDLEDMGYFGIDEISANGNFWIDADGIVFVYNRGEASSFSLGEIRIRLTFSELVDILKPDSVLQLFVKQ